MDIMVIMVKKKWLNVFLIGVLVVCVGFLVFYKENQGTTSTTDGDDYHLIQYQDAQYSYNTSMIQILFMGIDSSDGTMGQADSLQLYSLDRDHKEISVMSLNRDAMTEIELFDVEHNSLGWDLQHLALAYAYGSDAKNGSMLTMRAVSKMLFDIPINKFVALDLSKLKDVQNIVGSLDVVVSNDSLVNEVPAWTTGTLATITSENVELFVRKRDTNESYSNESRMERQRVYLNAYYAKIKEMLSEDFDGTVKRLYSVLSELTTNLTLEDVQDYADMILNYAYDDSRYYSLPGTNQTGELHDEFEIDQKALKALVVQLFYEKEE